MGTCSSHLAENYTRSDLMQIKNLFNYKNNDKLRDTVRLIGGIVFTLILILAALSLPKISKVTLNCLDTVYYYLLSFITNILSLLPTWLAMPIAYLLKIVFLLLLVAILMLSIFAISIAPSGAKGGSLLTAIRELFQKNNKTK